MLTNAPLRLAVLLAALSIALPSGQALAQPSLADPAAPADAADGTSTIAVVGVSSYDGLMTDVDFLGALMGQPNQAQAIEGMIGFFTGGQGLAGLDKSRPWGLVLQTDGSTFAPLVCLPVTDLDAMLALLMNFQVRSEPLDGGVYEIATQTQLVYAKQVDDWVVVGQTEESLDSAPDDPLPMLTSLVADYDIGARVLADQVPELFKQMAIGQLRAGLEAGLQQQAEESDDAFAQRRQMGEAQVQQIVDLINDLEELTIGYAIDAQTETMRLDGVAIAAEGSKLAAQVDAMYDSKTMLSGFVKPNASIVYQAAAKVPAEKAAEQAEQLDAALEQAIDQIMAEIDKSGALDDEASRELAEGAISDLMGALKAVSLSGVADFAMSAKLSPDRLTAIGAMRMPDTAKVESALKKLDELAKLKGGPDYPGFKWDFASYAGADFHALTFPVPAGKPEAIEMLGEEMTVAVGIAPDVAYLAAGKDSLPALKKAIEASQAAGEVEGKTTELTISIGDIMTFVRAVDTTANPMVAMIDDMIGDAEGSDHLRLSVEPLSKGARYRLEAEKGVIKAMAAGAAAARQAQMQGGF